MPRPLKGETKSSFISRAIRYLIRKEGLSKDHAVAKAHGIWRQHKKKGSK
jgi:hypothetical protein